MYYDQEQRQQSIQACLDCRNECQEALNRCLDMGGRHVEEQHIKLILDCIEVCQMAADFMTRHSSMYEVVCSACAKVCEACADSCEHIGGAEMKRCAEACRLCARHCENGMDSQSAAA